MKNNPQFIGVCTIVRREISRMFRIAGQVFLPPVITTLLYFTIFGKIIGSRMGVLDGNNYTTFIAPGLIMMTIITSAYSNVCTSLFNVRFQRSIEEILISPLHPSLILLGYTLGGVIRGGIVGTLVFLIASLFVRFDAINIPMTLLVVILVATFFSLIGFTNAMLAKSFDDIALVPTFILTPLTYLGGVFYTTAMLPPFWKNITYFNPIYYMVNALRHAMIASDEISIPITLSVIFMMLIGTASLNLIMLRKGVGIRG